MRSFTTQRRRLLVVVCILWLGVAGVVGQSPRQGEAAKRIIGTWRLVSIEEGNATSAANRGAHPTGLIIYDATGHMAVQIMADRVRQKWAAGTLPTPEQARDALLGYAAYFGTYTVDERAQTVTHHREGNINPGGLGDFVRHYEFEGDRVILTPLENPPDARTHLTWERVQK